MSLRVQPQKTLGLRSAPVPWQYSGYEVLFQGVHRSQNAQGMVFRRHIYIPIRTRLCTCVCVRKGVFWQIILRLESGKEIPDLIYNHFNENIVDKNDDLSDQILSLTPHLRRSKPS